MAKTPPLRPASPVRALSSRIAALLLGAVFVAIAAHPAVAAAPAGAVLAMGGQCFDEAAGQRRALKIGDPVYVGDTVEAPAAAKLKLRMSDGSVISVASSSRLTIRSYSLDGSGQRQNATLTLAQGLLRAVVSKVDHPAIFEVDTAVGTAAVRSTDWFIQARPGADRVGVLAGSVVLRSNATGDAVTIPARWGSRLEAGMDPVPARVWTRAEFDEVIQQTTVP